MLNAAVTARLPLAERAYVTLRDSITFGELRGGERLVEQDVAAKLGMSRTPVRQALQRLEMEGLAERHGSSLVVSPFSLEAALEVMFIRTLLEPVAARLSVRRIRPADIERLRAITSLMTDAAARNAGAGERARLNSEFHDVLYSRCPYIRLLATIQNLRGHFIAYELYARYRKEDYRRVLKEHKQIWRAAQEPLGTREALVEELVRAHLMRAQEPFARHLRADGVGPTEFVEELLLHSDNP